MKDEKGSNGEVLSPPPVAVAPPPADAAPIAAHPWGEQEPCPRSRVRILFEAIVIAVGLFGGLYFVSFIVDAYGVVNVALGTLYAVVALVVVMIPTLRADRWEPEPRLLLATAFLWGGGIATILSSELNDPVGQFLGQILAPAMDPDTAAFTFGAPIVEEGWKGIGVLLIFLVRRRHFNGPVDGVVYGAVVGAAFAFVENIQYLGEGADVSTFILRGFISPFGHLIYTACTGLALGFAAQHKNKWAWIWLAPLGFLVGTGMHMIWNATNYTTYGGLVALVLFAHWLPVVAWVYLLQWLRGKEIALIRDRLTEYVPSGWLTPDDVTMLTSLEHRRQALAWASRRGAAAKAAMKKFQKTALALAFARQDLHTGHVGIRAREDEAILLAQLASAREGFQTAA